MLTHLLYHILFILPRKKYTYIYSYVRKIYKKEILYDVTIIIFELSERVKLSFNELHVIINILNVILNYLH